MDKLRKAEIDWYLNNETDEEWTQEWRDELTAEESAYVQAQDEHYERGLLRICTAILVREQVRQRWPPEEIAATETIGDHCKVTLRSGEEFLARWTLDGGLKLDKIVKGGDGCVRRLA